MQRRKIMPRLLGALVVTLGLAFGARGAEDVKGIIISRTGETLIVTTTSGKVTVLLTEGTKTIDEKGLFGLEKHQLSNAVLIPGLKVKIKVSTDSEGRLVAEKIITDGDDLETAQMIQAGLHPTAEQVATNVDAIEKNRQGVATNQQNVATNQQNIAANQQSISEHRQKIDQNLKDIQEHTERFNRLDDFDVKAQATVNFKVRSATISKEDKEELKKLAQTAMGLPGYIIEVKGFADSAGASAMNEKLSSDRAEAVAGYLVRECNVPVRHLMLPGAMGEFQAAGKDEAGRAEDRRVEVLVLVNKGIAGS
jgi:outer membrane protein OmpA-like peptidoglycan-associated protein